MFDMRNVKGYGLIMIRQISSVIFRLFAVEDHRRVQVSVWYGEHNIYRVNSYWQSAREAYYASRRLARLSKLALYVKTPGRSGFSEAA